MNHRWWSAGLSAAMAIAVVGTLTACGGHSATPPTAPRRATTAATSTPPFTGAIPASCDPVATMSDVNKAVGHQLTGSSNLIIGIPEPSIHRTGRLDCYYGIPPNQPVTTAVLSISISGYATPQDAQHRVLETVNGARDTGYATNSVQVNGQNAVLLAGVRQEIVLAAGNLTILVAAANGVLPAGQTGPPLINLATRAVKAASAAGTSTKPSVLATPTPARSPTSAAPPRPTTTKHA